MDELCKALTRAANAIAAYYERIEQPDLPLAAPVATDAAQIKTEIAAVMKEPNVEEGATQKRHRRTKAEMAADAAKTQPAVAQPSSNPFEVGAQPAKQTEPAKTEPAAQAPTFASESEAELECMKQVGLYIRRFQKATPPGIDRARVLLQKHLGYKVDRFEDIKTLADRIKAIEVFKPLVKAKDDVWEKVSA